MFSSGGGVFSHNYYIIQSLSFYFQDTFFFFFQQRHIKLIKRDIKEVYNLTKYSYFKKINTFFVTFYSSWKKMYHCFHKNITAFNTECQHIRMISEGFASQE